MEAVVAAGRAEAAREPGAAAEVAQAAEHAQLGHELVRAVQDRRAGERQPQSVVRQGRSTSASAALVRRARGFFT